MTKRTQPKAPARNAEQGTVRQNQLEAGRAVS